MNRRAFLLGLAATAVATQVPPSLPTTATSNAELWFAEWMRDVEVVYAQSLTDLVCFGQSVIASIDEYPYIKATMLSEFSQQA